MGLPVAVAGVHRGARVVHVLLRAVACRAVRHRTVADLDGWVARREARLRGQFLYRRAGDGCGDSVYCSADGRGDWVCAGADGGGDVRGVHGAGARACGSLCPAELATGVGADAAASGCMDGGAEAVYGGAAVCDGDLAGVGVWAVVRAREGGGSSEEHASELQSRQYIV